MTEADPVPGGGVMPHLRADWRKEPDEPDRPIVGPAEPSGVSRSIRTMSDEWTEEEAALQRECWAHGFLLSPEDLAAELAVRRALKAEDESTASVPEQA